MTVLRIEKCDRTNAAERTRAIVRAYNEQKRLPGGGEPFDVPPPRLKPFYALVPEQVGIKDRHFWARYAYWSFWGELFQEVVVRSYPDWLRREAGVQNDGKHIQRADIVTRKGTKVELKLSTNPDSTKKTMNASKAGAQVAVFGRLTRDRKSIEVVGWIESDDFPPAGTPMFYDRLREWPDREGVERDEEKSTKTDPNTPKG